MKQFGHRWAIVAGLLAAAPPLAWATATPPASLRFADQDWEITCDNTRTCRAAGYHAAAAGGAGAESDEGGALPVSVLLTRRAGPRQPVQGTLQLGHPGEGAGAAGWPPVLMLTMRVDGAPAGELAIEQDNWTAPLAPAHTALLVTALGRQGTVAWSDGTRTWRLSSAGAAAVLARMDAFQGRAGTRAAAIDAGAADESRVLPPLPPPVVQAAPVPADDSVRLPASAMKRLRAALAASSRECAAGGLDDAMADLAVRRLSATKLLVSMRCTVAAYNDGAAYWVINAAPPYRPQLVTLFASGYAGGSLNASLKLHSGGDCWAYDTWTWDGRRFVHSAQETSGDCRGINAEGAWSLPQLVTTVLPTADSGGAARRSARAPAGR